MDTAALVARQAEMFSEITVKKEHKYLKRCVRKDVYVSGAANAVFRFLTWPRLLCIP